MSYRGARPASIATTGTALVGAVLTLALLAMGATVHAAPARADQVAYLVNVTVRPGYDFANADEYQASYLITQAANEISPARIWHLRNAAAEYRPPTP
jgi:hypothetical protein